MDNLDLLLVTPTPTQIYNYGEAFNEAFKFGVIMLLIGVGVGMMIGYGLFKVWYRGRIWPDQLA